MELVISSMTKIRGEVESFLKCTRTILLKVPPLGVRWNMAELQYECKALLSALARNMASLIFFTLAIAGEIEGRRGKERREAVVWL